MPKYSKEFHAHFCKTCGNWWEHYAPPADAPYSVNDAAHTCKCCGKEVWTWLDEEELADAIRRFAQRTGQETRPASRETASGSELQAGVGTGAMARLRAALTRQAQSGQ